MKKLIEHLCDEMLIAQIIYEFNVNLSHCSCSKYFVENEVWLNAYNLSITHLIIKLNDYNVDFFKIKHVFKNNSLIIELNLSTFMKIYLIFHVIFWIISQVTFSWVNIKNLKNLLLLRMMKDSDM